jgi:hypothetical protein
MLGHILHATFALLMLVTYQPGGALHLLVESNCEIRIDGRPAGTSSDAASGLLLDYVPVGEHDVLIKTETGATTELKVRIFDGEMTTVSVSSLGLRAGKPRGTESTIQAVVTSESLRCTLGVDAMSISGGKDQLKIERVEPGRHTISIICGRDRAEGVVDVPPSAVITVKPDFETGRIRSTHERPRVAMISVPTTADDIMELDLPLMWKRAISAALVSGIHVETIKKDDDAAVVATFTAPGWDALEEFEKNLRKQSEVRGVDTYRYGWIPNGIRFRMTISFRTPMST